MFYKRGPAAAIHRSSKLLFDRRTTHVAVSVDRSRRVLTSEVSWQSSVRYAGAWPVRHWKTRTAILKVTRWRTGSVELSHVTTKTSPSGLMCHSCASTHQSICTTNKCIPTCCFTHNFQRWLGPRILKTGHATFITPINGWFVIPMLTLDVAYLCTKFDNPRFRRTRDMTGTPKIQVGHVTLTTFKGDLSSVW